MCTVMLSKFFPSGATPEQMEAMQWASDGNYNPREPGGEFNQLKKIWR